MDILELTCNVVIADKVRFYPINGFGIVKITTKVFGGPPSSVHINKQEAAQLRDWLNEFLGE